MVRAGSTSRRTVKVFCAVAAATAIIFGAAAAADPALAQAVWTDRTVIVNELSNGYREAPQALGVTSDGAVLELFTSSQGESWTLVVTLPNGMSRVVATGEHWTSVPNSAKWMPSSLR
jgi:hypothetical protein